MYYTYLQYIHIYVYLLVAARARRDGAGDHVRAQLRPGHLSFSYLVRFFHSILLSFIICIFRLFVGVPILLYIICHLDMYLIVHIHVVCLSSYLFYILFLSS